MIVSFRIYNKNCPECRNAAVLSREDRKWFEARNMNISGDGAMRAEGCPACMGTGVSGRVIQEEVLSVTDSLIHEIRERAGEPIEDILRNHITRNPENQQILDDISRGIICSDELSILKESL